MSVVLRIMSGAFQGESVELDGFDFSLGGRPDCDVVFDPNRDRGALGTRVALHRDKDQWQVRRLEGKSVLVNQKILDTVLPIRCGDVIRMSPEGPDVRFLEAPAPGAHPATGLAAAAASPAPAEADRSGSSAGGTPEPRAPSRRRPALAALAALIAALLIALPLGFSSRRPKVVFDGPTPPRERAQPPGSTPGPPPAPAVPGAGSRGIKGQTLAKSPQTPTDPPLPRLPPVVILVARSRGDYPAFGVAAAIKDSGGRKMLLTTGRLAHIMSKFHWTNSTPFWAAVPGEPGGRTGFAPVDGRAIYCHRLYVEAVNRGDLQGAAHFNVAILICDKRLPASCLGRLAGREGAASVARGASLSVWVVSVPPIPSATWNEPYESKVSRVPVRVEQVVALDEGAKADDTRHLFVLNSGKQPLPEGSPVVNNDGDIVAICAQPPLSVASGNKSHLSVAVPVDDRLIGSLWERHGAKQWVADCAAPAPSTRPETRLY